VIAVFLKNGYIQYVFNCGGPKSVEIVSTDTYNDGELHTIEFTRNGNKGSLTIDDADTIKSELSSSARTMEITSLVYIGGFDPAITEEILLKLNLERSFLEQPFVGCVTDMEYNKTYISEYNFKTTPYGVVPCSEEIEDGVFFQGGLLKLREKFVVGNDLTITMDIKPRTETAILLSVHGKKAFFIIQLLNGTVVFSVDNGVGPINTIYKPDEDENLCDGNWHTLKAIKSGYVTTIVVDNRSSDPAIGDHSNYNTQTNRPLFVGGHPHMQKVIAF
jgi:laminin alpha 3/5